MVPVHNGTFDLSLHPWYEPFERIRSLARAAGVQVATPMMGERLALAQPQEGGAWWHEAMPETAPAVSPGGRASTPSTR
jgi:hypothetical protein